MKDYKLNGSVYEITLENDKKVKVATSWVEKTIKLLETDLEDVLLMWLEDEGYLVNEEQEELVKQAKANGVKIKADTDKGARHLKKTLKDVAKASNSNGNVTINMNYKTTSGGGYSNKDIENIINNFI